MKRFILILIFYGFLISCNQLQQTSTLNDMNHKRDNISANSVATMGQVSPYLSALDLVTKAINREDWVSLNNLISQEMLANRYIDAWKANPIRVGEMQSVQYAVELNGKSCAKYSYQLKFKDGRPHPHFLIVLACRVNSLAEVLDFYEFGW